MPKDQFITLNGLNCRYWQQGEQGSAILCIHGLGGYIENWQFNFEALSQHHRVFALDLPGFGQSDKPKKTYSVTFFIETLVAFLQAKQIEKVHVIGNSLGGGAALMLAISHPELVDKVVLACPAGLSRKLPFIFKVLTIDFLNRLLINPSLQKCRKGLELITTQHGFITDDYVKKSYQYASSKGAKQALISVIKDMCNLRGVKTTLLRGISENLTTLKAPVLAIWGKDDPLLPFVHAKKTLSKIPNLELTVLKDCGHMPQCEFPEVFNQAVLGFVK